MVFDRTAKLRSVLSCGNIDEHGSGGNFGYPLYDFMVDL